MKLRCVRHGKRVQVINIGTDTNRIPLTVHRTHNKNNEVCDSNTLVIGGEFFTPNTVISSEFSEDSNDSEMVGA